MMGITHGNGVPTDPLCGPRAPNAGLANHSQSPVLAERGPSLREIHVAVLPIGAQQDTTSTSTIGRMPSGGLIAPAPLPAAGAFHGYLRSVREAPESPDQVRAAGLSSFRTPNAIHGNGSPSLPQNEIFADWGQWRERGRLNQDLEDAIDVLVTAADWSFAWMTVDSSRDRWAYGSPGGLGIVPVAPTVTFGGQTIYFDTLNTAQVGLNPDDGPSPRQPRIAVTNVASLEWEQVAWSREVWIADYQTSTGMAKLTTGYDGYLVYPHYRHHPEILQPLEHTTVRVKVELVEPVPDGMVGRLHLAGYDPDNTLANEPTVPPAHNGHGRRDNAEDVELIEAGAPFGLAPFSEDVEVIPVL